jgi:hypothetical protein
VGDDFWYFSMVSHLYGLLSVGFPYKPGATGIRPSQQRAVHPWSIRQKPTAVGDTEGGPKGDILGQAGAGIGTEHYLDFPA